MKSGPRILTHFGVGRASFYLFYLSIFIYFYLFLFISIDFYWFPWFLRFPRIFYISIIFSEFAERWLLPHFQNRSDLKMPTGRGNLRTESFHFFFKGCSESIFPSQWSKFLRFCDEKSHFLDFRKFCNFWKPRVDIFQIFGVRHKDFKAFWSPAQGF